MAAELTRNGCAENDAARDLELFRRWRNSTPEAHGTPLGRGYQASIEVFHSPYGSFVVKMARGVFLWRKLGQAALRREYRAYLRTTGIPGIPRCLGLLDDNALVIEYIDGDTFRRREHELQDRDVFFRRLLETIRRLHAAGVAHGDLKRKDNILVGPAQRPYLVDFGVASLQAGSSLPWSRAMFRWMRQYDYNAWVKHKYQRNLDRMAEEDAKLYQPTWPERGARVIRIIWQKLTLRRMRKRWWARLSRD
jgi:predicted Ser/Thr protein kinase